MELDKSGGGYTITAQQQELGRLSYDDERGAVTGDVGCTRGGMVRLKGLAVDRNINNVLLLPLDKASAWPEAGAGGQVRCASGGREVRCHEAA